MGMPSCRSGLAWPTEEELARAVETLAAIAAIDSLRGGVVEFDAAGLAGGRWYEPGEQSNSLMAVWAPVPPMGPPDRLLESCRAKIELALEVRQRQLVDLAFGCADRDQDAGVYLGLQLMYE
jgi:hypothetical protein